MDKLYVDGKPAACPKCHNWIDLGNLCVTHIQAACADCCGCN